MKLSKEELLKYFDAHVKYEIQMLQFTSKLPLLDGDDAQTLYCNMVFESFCIHLRNLLNFFYPPNSRKPSDVYAEYYFEKDNWWKENVVPISDSLEKARFRVNKEVGHLTTERIASMIPEKEWDRSQLMGEIVPIVTLFWKNADYIER
jgi:hypothetical protein